MIEKIQIANFLQTVFSAQNFSINIGNEGSFKLIRSIIVNTDAGSASFVWGFSASSDGTETIDVAGVNGVNGPVTANTPTNIVDDTSMIGTNHAYAIFTVTQQIESTLDVIISYYSFQGLTPPSTNILNGTIAVSASQPIQYGTTPKLEVVKSLWISPALGGAVSGTVELVSESGQSSVSIINLNNKCGNMIPSSYGIWLPDNTQRIIIENSDSSNTPMTYYFTGIGRP